ncbi:hypothetical protein B0T22DRAFT_436099 [Podospora appendiculata]|uniref:Uncharacterized protein n=1 Tax=Podospora appendiculata TaxID=314037 RepID=A0AAE0XGL8_9PEZI|nr:hypothetical protein B0T22DRAFT_436099 [Podospora appendiculata]
MAVPQTYDPDTYDPNKRMPWTPEPEPYDPETYAAWGRKNFGQEWDDQRTKMLQERNIYMHLDPVYLERQRALRLLEHEVEGRPFKPGGRAGWMHDQGWRRLWARLSKGLPSAEQDSDSPPPDDSESDLRGFNTRFRYTEERYQFERISLRENLIDRARKKHEDEEGDRRREKELDEIRKIRYVPGTLGDSAEYHFRMRIDAKDRAVVANARYFAKQMISPPDQARHQQEMNQRLIKWCVLGGRREEFADEYGFPEKPASTDGYAGDGVVPLQPQASRPQQRHEEATAQPPTRRRPSGPDVLEALGDNTRIVPPHRRQRKRYEKERASRRLAKQPPEFAPSSTVKASRPDPRSKRLSKKPTAIAVKGAKPQGITKSRHAGIEKAVQNGRPKG